MTEADAFNIENRQERERLRALAAKLDDADLGRPLPNGWTVGGALVHLAFWDLRQLEVLKRWIAKGVHPIPVDSRTVNDALGVLTRSIPPRAVAALAVQAAEAIDQELEKISPELAAEILKQGHERMLRRALHRREHLDKIERIL